jgi:hypothetical protein
MKGSAESVLFHIISNAFDGLRNTISIADDSKQNLDQNLAIIAQNCSHLMLTKSATTEMLSRRMKMVLLLSFFGSNLRA